MKGLNSMEQINTENDEQADPALDPIRICPPVDPSIQKSTANMILTLVKGIKIGSDLTTVAVPPVFNIPKSQLQMFSEAALRSTKDLLGACTSAASPLERFIAVVRWHISTTRHTPFGKTPYNPILGETHHVSIGDLNVMLEQVSHHPPISAMRAVDEKRKLIMTWWHKPTPNFYGSWMEAEIQGRRLLELVEHGEMYESSSPRISFRFFPNPGTEWVGKTFVKCLETGYEAVVEYKKRPFFGLGGAENGIGGNVVDKDQKVLFELQGSWDGIVNIKDVASGKVEVLYDHVNTVTNLEAPIIENPKALASTETFLVWSKLTNALLDEDYETARTEKAKVENAQRALRKARKERGEVWEPSFFMLDEAGNWVWKDAKKGVGRSPVVAPSPEPFTGN